MPNEFVVRGHIVVSDHAAIPTGTELHSDVASDDVMDERKRRVVEGTFFVMFAVPSLPMGQRSL